MKTLSSRHFSEALFPSFHLAYNLCLVFTSGKKLVYRTIYSPLYLEDLIEKVNIKKQLELEKLTFNLLIYPLSNETLEAMKEKYNKAVGNLHKSAPNLKHIDIMGGHSLMRQNGVCRIL